MSFSACHMGSVKQRISERFGAAAEKYDAASAVQAEVAARLACRVKTLALPKSPRVLEIGCGTGHLSRLLMEEMSGEWFISDISLAMVRNCREKLSSPNARFLVLDGERPSVVRSRFDLIVSSLAVQWFTDLPNALEALASLLAPGGYLAFVTLGSATFNEWRAAHLELGYSAGTPTYPDIDELRFALPSDLDVQMAEEAYVVSTGHPLNFMRSLRAIGADTPIPGREPLGPGAIRQVLRKLERGSTFDVTYHLLYAIATRKADRSGRHSWL